MKTSLFLMAALFFSSSAPAGIVCYLDESYRDLGRYEIRLEKKGEHFQVVEKTLRNGRGMHQPETTERILAKELSCRQMGLLADCERWSTDGNSFVSFKMVEQTELDKNTPGGIKTSKLVRIDIRSKEVFELGLGQHGHWVWEFEQAARLPEGPIIGECQSHP